MKIAILNEIGPGENRVAATPDTAARIIKMGYEVWLEKGAGSRAGYADALYAEKGVKLSETAEELYNSADIIFKVLPPALNEKTGKHEADLIRPGTLLASFFWPAQNKDLLEKLNANKVNVFAMDTVPRITRAQSLDALSSLANVAGYRAVVEAANQFGRFMQGQITAAGKVPPAKVFIIGAGVAGLAAIGAAKNLGAIVRAFDTRPVVKEQIESMGGEFLELDFKEDGTGTGGYAKEMSPEFIAAEMALFLKQAKEVDIIITTAQIPGKKAPLLVTREHVEAMKAGSVIVDLAASSGGNCELTQAGKTICHNGVFIIGGVNQMAMQTSQLYGMNLVNFLNLLGKAEAFNINIDDDIIYGAMVAYQGQVRWPVTPKPGAAVPQTAAPAPVAPPVKAKSKGHGHGGDDAPMSAKGVAFIGILIAAVLTVIGIYAPAEFLSHFTVFVLACLLGWQVIWSVTPSLHTPLMSVTNAISGIIVVGGMVHISGEFNLVQILALVAILVATINIVGGFTVTHRMLKMFSKGGSNA